MLSKRVILRTGCPDPNSNMAVASSMASSKVPAGNSGVRRVRLDLSAPPSARARPLRGLLFAGAFFAGGAPCDLFTDTLTVAGVGVVGRATPSVEVCDGSRSLGSDGETPLTSAVPRWMSITGQDTFDRLDSGGAIPRPRRGGSQQRQPESDSRSHYSLRGHEGGPSGWPSVTARASKAPRAVVGRPDSADSGCNVRSESSSARADRRSETCGRRRE